MAGRLDGKVALISGGARGMGACEGALFAREGAHVVLADVLEEETRKRVDELSAAGHQALALRLDVTSESDWEAAVAATEERFGQLDVLVNNAGIADPAGIEDTTREQWDRIIAVNQTGVWLGMKAAAPAMRRAGGGSMINISSIYGLVGSATSAAYHASKGAVRIVTKTAALQFAPDGIRVNSVHPGFIDTQMLRGTPKEISNEELDAMIAEITPLGRVGTAEEIANGVLFLASDESSFVTGSELVIDGGYTAR